MKMPCENCLVFPMCKSKVVLYNNDVFLWNLHECDFLKEWVGIEFTTEKRLELNKYFGNSYG